MNRLLNQHLSPAAFKAAYLSEKGRIAMLPQGLILGTEKAGTTTLFRYLQKHPNFVSPRTKEVRYFNDFYSRGIEWYREQFRPLQKKHWLKVLNGEKVITGEATPRYLYTKESLDRIAELLPNARFIALIRNPIDRAHSQYRQSLAIPERRLTSFETHVEREIQFIEKHTRFKRDNPDHDWYGKLMVPHSFIAKGFYVYQIKRWHERFPKDQLMIIQSEAFYRNAEKFYLEVQEFLGLPEFRLNNYSRENKSADQSPLNPETRKYLEEYYRPYNQELYDYLGVDFGW